MCGRFALNDKVNDAITEFVRAGGEPRDYTPSSWEPNYNVSPTDVVPILRERIDSASGDLVRLADPAEWNFAPSWFTRPGVQINARLETVATNGLFKSAFRSHRCLVPMLGYYEWTGQKNKRQPHFLHGPEDVLMAAGIYAAVKDDSSGEWTHNVAIITREARDASGEIHDRMPVFVTEPVWDTWLQPGEITKTDEMTHLLDEVSTRVAASITSYPVTPELNNSRARERWDDPRLLDPVHGLENPELSIPGAG